MKELIGVLVGGCLGIAGSWLPYWVQARKEKLERQRSVLENIYDDIRKWYRNLFIRYSYCVLVIDGELDWNQYLDKISDTTENSKHNILKIRINLYFTELTDAFEKLEKEMQDIWSYITDEIKAVYCSGHDLSKYKTLLYERMQKVNKAQEEFENEVTYIARKLK